MRWNDLIPAEEIWRESLLAKLKGLIPWRTFERLNECGRTSLYRECKNCAKWKEFDYHCNLKWCPLCNWRISRRRAELLETWVKHVQQPKHLVLTRQNFELITRSKVKNHGKDLAALRRSKAWSDVKGGCASTEITNSGNGWHLHTHLLVDCRWLKMPEIEAAWAKRCSQNLAVCKVKDARDKDYLGEVCKYVCKPAEMVSWKPDEIWQFIKAIERTRFFATFGSLWHEGPQVRSEIAAKHAAARTPTLCECGCAEFIWKDETTMRLSEIRNALLQAARKPSVAACKKTARSKDTSPPLPL